MRKELDKEKEEIAHNNGQLEGYEAGLREGYNVGLKKGEGNRKVKEEAWMKKYGKGHHIPLGTWLQDGVQCDEEVQTDDRLLRLLNDAGTSIKHPGTCKTAPSQPLQPWLLPASPLPPLLTLLCKWWPTASNYHYRKMLRHQQTTSIYLK